MNMQLMTNQMIMDLLNSFKDPVLLADGQHIIRFMNKPAISHYKEGMNLIGTNVLDCHTAVSQRIMLELWQNMQNQGLVEALITDNKKYRIYMRVVLDNQGKAVGYFERYEPPVIKYE
ncbi:hypothetical protein GF406_20905 [candidate division KSB1 bacterium]|jgi:nitrogen-specific signal transduction histidine kinase|nr:hypothetical protein [candidate division KSB1 bacterium]